MSGAYLIHRTRVTGTSLTLEWAVVRLRRFLEERGGSLEGGPTTPELSFDVPLGSVRLTGFPAQSSANGTVRIARHDEAIEVTASTSLLLPLLTFLGGVGVVSFLFRHAIGSPGYWLLIGIGLAFTVFRLNQAANALRDVTIADAGLADQVRAS